MKIKFRTLRASWLCERICFSNSSVEQTAGSAFFLRPLELCNSLLRSPAAPSRLLSPIVLFLLSIATAAADVSQAIPPEDDFSPGMFFFALVGIAIVFLLIGASIVIVGIIAACVGILTALGIVSSSAFIGIFRRRLSSGIRAFLYQVCAVIGLPCGVGLLWLGTAILNVPLRHRDILLIGSGAGICAGLLLAFSFDLLASIVYHRLISAPTPTTGCLHSEKCGNTVLAAVFRDGQIVVSMSNGAEIRFPVEENPRLASGTPEQLNHIEISPFGLHWPELDEDLSLRGIAAGDFGQRTKKSCT